MPSIPHADDRKLKTVELSWTGSLYEPSSDILLAKLEALLGTGLSPGDIVILRSDADLHDYSFSWLQFIRDDAMWIDLYRRLTRWHTLFAKIVQSKSKFVFISGRDVVGSWWELALACHGRIFTNPYAKVGFPEIYIDMFPPLGILGLKKIETYDGPSSIRKHAIVHAREAFKIGVVDLCLLSDLWIRNTGILCLKSWLEAFQPKHDDRSFHRTDYTRALPSEAQIVEQRTDPNSRMVWLSQVRVDTSFSLLRERSVGVRALALAQMRAASCIRFLHGDYRAWLSRRVTRYRLGLHDRWWSAATNVIIIDVSEGLPPAEVVKNLLLRRKRIIFTAANHEVLRSALESIRGRFDRRDSEGRDAFNAWDQAVGWVSAPRPSEARSLRCSFQADDRVILERGDARIDYMRISGNYAHAGIGWYEQLTREELLDSNDSNVQEIQETIALMANGVLSPVNSMIVKDKYFPLTTALRFLLLEFLVRFGERVARCNSLTALLKMLGTSGWGFAADQFQWENLLKYATPTDELVKQFSGVWGNAEESHEWKILGLTSVLTITYERSKDETASAKLFDIRSGASVTRYISVFAHAVVSWLVAQNIVENRDEADLFVSLAWGYPGAIPLPSTLDRELGKVRLNRWLKQATPGVSGPPPQL